jgi:hypothetical protein
MTNALPRVLLSHLLDGAAPARVSVIGLSKNAGKTVTLTHIIRAAAADDLPLGLVSTGRDGEDQDAVTELPKPHIWAPSGAFVVTAEAALTTGSARIQPEEYLPMSTQFGRVVLGRVTAAGKLLLIGPGTASRIGEALKRLESRGARLCLVDGSFDRIAAAAPAITGRVVLAAGAAYSTSMQETISQVRHVLDILDLPQLLPAMTDHVEEALKNAPVSVVTLSGAITPVAVPSALSNPEEIVEQAMAQEAYGAYLVMRGALGDRLLQELLRRRARNVALVVTDPTHVLVDRNLWRRWRRQGGIAYVRRPVQVVAVTTNPHSPVGHDYDAREFFRAVQQMTSRPVFDLEAGLPQT